MDYRLLMDVSPSSRRRFGVEVETSTPYAEVARIFETSVPGNFRRVIYKDFNCPSEDRNKWYVKTDGSTESEVTTPAVTLRHREYARLPQLLKSMRGEGVRVTGRDGLHVHVEARDVPADRLLISWLLLERAFVSMFPAHRFKSKPDTLVYDSGGKYAKRYIYRERGDSGMRIIEHYERTLARSTYDKYLAMSLRNHAEDGTVEFRMSEGSLDFRHVDCLVRTLLCFVEYAKRHDMVVALMTTMRERPGHLCEAMRIKERKILEWIEDRTAEHGER